MRVFITGICGFLGSHLAEQLLKQGHTVSGNDNLLCGDEENVDTVLEFYHHVDCRDFGAMEKILKDFSPDVVVHCAATAHEGLSSFSPSFITKNIYEASVATFSASISAGAKRIVYMSSMSRYGAQEPPFSEDMPTKPVDPYGVAKVAAEETLKILCDTHGLKWSIAVPHNIIGVKQRYVDPFRNVASIMLNRCLLGKPPVIYGDGMQKRCFSPVADCIPSIVKMVEGYADSEVVNIGPDAHEIPVLDLAVTVAEITGYRGKFEFMPDRPNEVKHAYTTSDKARRLLGYKEQQSVIDCLNEMAENIAPQPFKYEFPIEIEDGCPEVWKKRLM